MPLAEAIRLALRSLLANKLKSGFSLVGVFIGVTFLIAVVSIVEGMNRYMTERFVQTILGVNTFQLRRRPDVNFGDTPDEVWRAWNRRPYITYEDAQAVEQGMRTPVISAWQSSSRAPIEYRGRIANDIELTGATERIFEIRNLRIEQGRAFTAQEVRAGQPVLVLLEFPPNPGDRNVAPGQFRPAFGGGDRRKIEQFQPMDHFHRFEQVPAHPLAKPGSRNMDAL